MSTLNKSVVTLTMRVAMAAAAGVPGTAWVVAVAGWAVVLPCRDLGRRRGREHRLLAVGDHPIVPQDDQRDGEHDPQNGTFIEFH
jgi:hypothetical protein